MKSLKTITTLSLVILAFLPVTAFAQARSGAIQFRRVPLEASLSSNAVRLPPYSPAIAQDTNHLWVGTASGNVNLITTGGSGPAGAAGAAGTLWYTGTGTPGAGVGTNADLYLDTATGNVYSRPAGTWGQIASIKGGTGATGATGATGGTGAAGTNGTNGANGATGATGATGPAPTGTDTQTLRFVGTALAATSNLLTNTGGQTAIGGAIDTGSRVSVNPQGTSENGLTINMPSGASGFGLRIKNSTGSDMFSLDPYGGIYVAGALTAYSSSITSSEIDYGTFEVRAGATIYGGLSVPYSNLSVPSGYITAGGFASSVRVITATDTASTSDSVLLCNGTFTETLPATGWPTGYRLTVKDRGTGTVTLTAGGTVTFDGATTLTFATQYKSRVLIWNGTNFSIESGYL